MICDKRSIRRCLWVRLGSAALLIQMAGTSHGQVQLPPVTTTTKSACATADDSPTWKSCWECYKDLMIDCTDTFDSLDEMKECYQTARHFYQICMAQTVGVARATNINIGTQQFEALDLRSSHIFQATTLEMVDPTKISVYLVSKDNDGARFVCIDSETDISSVDWLTFEIMIDPTTLGLKPGESIGLVVAINDPISNTPADLNATALVVTDSYDLNGDGVFDSRDYLAAIIQYGNGELDSDSFYEIAGEYRHR